MCAGPLRASWTRGPLLPGENIVCKNSKERTLVHCLLFWPVDWFHLWSVISSAFFPICFTEPICLVLLVATSCCPFHETNISPVENKIEKITKTNKKHIICRSDDSMFLQVQGFSFDFWTFCPRVFQIPFYTCKMLIFKKSPVRCQYPFFLCTVLYNEPISIILGWISQHCALVYHCISVFLDTKLLLWPLHWQRPVKQSCSPSTSGTCWFKWSLNEA